MLASDPGFGTWLSDTLKTQINRECEADNSPRYSWRVKPSSLGDECVARQWYQFRWVLRKQVDGRTTRIFSRGNGTEPRLIKYLERAGWSVDSIDPAHKNPNFPQYSKKLLDGHLKAFIDGKASHPVYSNGEQILVEFKSYNTKRFNHLCNKKLKEADIEYYGQIVIYLKEFDLPWCLFVAENKNDDDLYFEVIMRDDLAAQVLLRTAETIITSVARPARYSESAAHHVCKYCDYVNICHRGEPVDINCRSCINCVAIAGGKFRCEFWQAVIPNEAAMLAACSNHCPVR